MIEFVDLQMALPLMPNELYYQCQALKNTTPTNCALASSSSWSTAPTAAMPAGGLPDDPDDHSEVEE